MLYEFQEACLVDSTKISAKLGVHATPIDDAHAATLGYDRGSPGSSLDPSRLI